MSEQKKPQIVQITEAEKDALLERLKNGVLSDVDKETIAGVIQNQHWLLNSLKKGLLSIHKLKKMLFGNKSEKQDGKSEDSNEKEEPEPDIPESRPAANKKRKGHGRIGSDAYKTKEKVDVLHSELKAGDRCPEVPCSGKLYAIEPGTFLHITGQSLARVIEYQIEKLRCSACGLVVSAPFDRTAKYDSTFKSQLALQRFFLGIPSYRQMAFQKMQGIPLPESTQWGLLEELANVVIPVCKYLEYCAAQGDLIQNDDTSVKILSLMGKFRPKERPGTYTTGIAGQHGGFKIRLFYSGRNHAGENLSKILRLRHAGLPPILQMCDGLSANHSDQPVILCNCLAHARRKFIEIEHLFKSECAFVIRLIGQIYHNEAVAIERKLTSLGRLAWHQECSQKVMDELHEYLMALEVEPNSAMGGAAKYMLTRWNELTQFLRVSGAPLDNNETERALKAPIRSRKNSLFHKTEYSAQIAAYIMSIIYTCDENGVNPLPYLVTLQENKEAVLREPEKWLPWHDMEIRKIA